MRTNATGGSRPILLSFQVFNVFRPFDCGLHSCSKSCHPPSSVPPPCPRSPSQTTHCPCGKHELSPSNVLAFPSDTILPRRTCSDPVPTCHSTCMKPLAECGHVCSSKCHNGPCPPCTIMLVKPCRCGTTTKDVRCSTIYEGAHSEILCDRLCPALRICGRHQCNRVCCPLASLASVAKGKGKKRGVVDQAGLDETGLHECDLVCGKMLNCGNHRCEERDHKGSCPQCLRSGFEEVCFSHQRSDINLDVILALRWHAIVVSRSSSPQSIVEPESTAFINARDLRLNVDTL